MADNSLISPAPLAFTAEALRTNEIDLLQYIDQVCDRIDVVEDYLQTLLPEDGRRERLKRDAEALQRRYPIPDERPPLYGVPAGIKDIFGAAGFPTQAGSLLPPELFQRAEAACVQRLKDAGALVLGKTVTTEFAFFEPGPTRNPHNLQHTPGGSSSGSAAAVAAGITPLALGTQTIGSTIRPAAYCGIVGFKPSYGRIDPTGAVFVAPSLDHVGLFTQDIAGMRLAASVMCADWRMLKLKPQPVLGVPEGPYLWQASVEGLQAFEEQVTRLEQAGYTVKRVRMLENIAALNEQHRDLMAAEMAQQHSEWFAHYGYLYRPRTVDLIQRGQQVSAQQAAEIRAQQQKIRAELQALAASAQVDLWLAPAAKGGAPAGLEATGDPVMSFPWTFAGLPTVALPAGTNLDGLPLGVQCVAGFGQDEALLGWSQALAERLQDRTTA